MKSFDVTVIVCGVRAENADEAINKIEEELRGIATDCLEQKVEEVKD